MSEPIVVERTVSAPPSAVYSYLTESGGWTRWQGVGADISPTPGGLFSVAMPNGATARGEFVELVDDRRVVFTWGWIDHPGLPPGSTRVEIDLIEEGDLTRIRLTHRDLPEDERPLHLEGWERYVGRLVVVAAGGDPGPDGPQAEEERR